MPVVGRSEGIVRLRLEDGDHFTIPVRWREVESSNIDMVGWDDSGNMYVRYKSGSVYAYLGVSRQRAVACAYHPSCGKYMAYRVKPKYLHVKIH